MRIIAIGIGGAGCRIVDRLHMADRRSKVACVQALAVDVDGPTLEKLESLPENLKIYFPPIDPVVRGFTDDPSQTAAIDIGEVISKVHNLASAETDAVFLYCGLGGGLADIAPHIIAGLRESIVEPIFGLIVLPCLAEGNVVSAKAADDLDTLFPLLDGIILFDNETWYKKTRDMAAALTQKERGFAEMIGLRKSEAPLSEVEATYRLLNDAIVKRISLILKAGEFNADGGIDHSEVVLDSGEVLNTMKGMGLITIGYAFERIGEDHFNLRSLIKTGTQDPEVHRRRASRIVELAKQAIYHEVSTPCDMTSAHKALILVAGPSHEISMKGFMTVRKWIDRSIAGLETRSGDYPVMNTKNVAIIIMLSGLENIPRVAELREIREQIRNGNVGRNWERPGESGAGSIPISLEKISLPPRAGMTGSGPDHPTDPILPERSGRRPQVLPSQEERMAQELQQSSSGIDPARPDVRGKSIPDKNRTIIAGVRPDGLQEEDVQESITNGIATPVINTGKVPGDLPEHRRKIIITAQQDRIPSRAISNTSEDIKVNTKANVFPELPREQSREKQVGTGDRPPSRSYVIERQKIEKELLKQRSLAIRSTSHKEHPHPDRSSHGEHKPHYPPPSDTGAHADPGHTSHRVVRMKRKESEVSPSRLDRPPHKVVLERKASGDPSVPFLENDSLAPAPTAEKVAVSQHCNRANDEIFSGKDASEKTAIRIQDEKDTSEIQGKIKPRVSPSEPQQRHLSNHHPMPNDEGEGLKRGHRKSRQNNSGEKT